MQFWPYIDVSDDFTQNHAGECSEANTFGTYESFELAEIGCYSNMACIGIYDEGCDATGTYRLCKEGFMNPSTSCIYQKKAYKGIFYITISMRLISSHFSLLIHIIFTHKSVSLLMLPYRRQQFNMR